MELKEMRCVKLNENEIAHGLTSLWVQSKSIQNFRQNL